MIPRLDVYLAAGQPAASEDELVGRCRFEVQRGRLSGSFTYDESYLSRPDAFALDPSLPLRSARHFFTQLPGALRDASPDRWGRHLISRDRTLEAVGAGTPPRTLDDVDYLLGVHDSTRQGALRFSEPESPIRLSDKGGVPPLVELKRLVAASNAIARGSDGHEHVKELLEAGSGSIGGARPKAAVLDEGRLLIAKFSHPGDERDVMAWEKTALDLAKAAGIPAPKASLVRLGTDRALVLERFDRTSSLVNGPRIPYLSAMSLLGSSDGEQRDYVEVAEAMTAFVGDITHELHSLFRRIAFSIALHNTDDHLRNLGFLRDKQGWHLSPIFDVNPEPDPNAQRATGIFGETGRNEARGLVKALPAFGLDPGTAQPIVRDVLSAMAQWRQAARRNGCRDEETRLFKPVFAEKAQALRAAFGIAG